MNEKQNIVGKHVLLFTKNGFRYNGTITAEDELFIYIYDTKEQRTFLINKSEVTTIEVKEWKKNLIIEMDFG